MKRLIVLAGLLLVLRDAQGAGADSLEALSLEELMTVEVTSVSKRPQRLADAAAAIYVITAQDLRRSGVTSIPEALRMVPGLHVAQINASQWAISARGFNGRFANKLLVLIDGRSVYSPLFSGVYWDVQDLMLEDVERIEVIRGPGATMWGANAVNGVINIITHPSGKTQGGLVTALGGTEERQLALRYGGTLGTQGTFRLYGKGRQIDAGEDADGNDVGDGWRQGRIGGRADWLTEAGDTLTLDGGMYLSPYDESGRVETLATYPDAVFLDNDSVARGGHLLGRWQNVEGSSLQLYYDHADRDELIYDSQQEALDIDWQQPLAWGKRQQIIWGLGYRWTRDLGRVTLPETLNVADTEESQQLFSGFVQDDITLLPETLVFTLGSKLEHNDYTGWELQPNARLVWKPATEHILWTAVSRAVRTPSRIEDSFSAVFDIVEVSVPPAPSFPATFVAGPNKDFAAEELVAFEGGYRYNPAETFSLDISAFYNLYDHLRTAEFQSLTTTGAPVPTSGTLGYQVANKSSGRTLGTEVVAHWQVTSRWRLQATYSYLNMLIELDGDSTDLSSVTRVHEIYPHHQAVLRSQLDLLPGVDIDLWLRGVGPVENTPIDGYLTLDARLAWEVCDRLELSLVGRNLIGNHEEFQAEFARSRVYEVRPSAYLMLRYEF